MRIGLTFHAPPPVEYLTMLVVKPRGSLPPCFARNPQLSFHSFATATSVSMRWRHSSISWT